MGRLVPVEHGAAVPRRVLSVLLGGESRFWLAVLPWRCARQQLHHVLSTLSEKMVVGGRRGAQLDYSVETKHGGDAGERARRDLRRRRARMRTTSLSSLTDALLAGSPRDVIKRAGTFSKIMALFVLGVIHNCYISRSVQNYRIKKQRNRRV